jgi:steroid 5-alpha reductase family enzyme
MVTASVLSPSRTCGAVIVVAWAGLVLAALGDITKSIVKARLGPDTLVVGGIFRLFRHPNYTGEQLLWTANLLAAFVAAAEDGASSLLAHSGWLVASLLGWAGMIFVLARATANLERQQAQRFDTFRKWRRTSWGGFTITRGDTAETNL